MVDDFDFFMFDFDGLLVDTESLHFEAYKQMVKNRGFELSWSFDQFCSYAHADGGLLKQNLLETFPSLNDEDWSIPYNEKASIYETLLLNANVQLMPGVEELLEKLVQKRKKSVVVTNSRKVQTDLIRMKNKTLSLINYWVTREDYLNAKPDPDGYLKAIELYGKENVRLIGFEDTIKGLKALMAANVTSVLICSEKHPQMQNFKFEKAIHFSSFFEISSQSLSRKDL